MTARRTTRAIHHLFNELRRGATYRVTTRHGTTTGEYLGIESHHGDRALLLRHRAGTESVPVWSVTSIVA